MIRVHSRPKQRVPKSEKTADWYEENGKYYRDACQPAIDEAEALKNYRLANGELDEKDYLYVTNPINSKRWELQGYPAKMRNYDIISPNVNTLMGEKSKRRFTPIVYARNHNYTSDQARYYKQLMTEHLQQMFVNNSVAMGVPLEEEEIVYKFDEIARKVKNLPDEVTKQGQAALEFIMDYNDLFRHFRKGFYDFIVNAMTYYYNDVINNRTHFEIVSPVNINYLCSPHHDFIEDGESVKCTHKLSVSEIYDRFQGVEGFNKQELQDFLERQSGGQNVGRSDSYYYASSDVFAQQSQLYRNVFGTLPEEQYSDGIEVDHILWRSSIKVGKITTTDIFGNVDYIYVDETFKDRGEFEIEWRWVDEICEVYCIGDNYYIGGRPIPIQRGEYNNPGKAKLLYNGRNFFSRHTRPRSIVTKGDAFQKSVNIVKYRAEESLLKSLDKIILFPLGLIPKKEGWDEDKLMYYVRAFSFLFFDDTRSNASAMVQALKELDLSMSEHITRSFELVAAIKAEYDELCGINRQRKGNFMASDGKATSQFALQTGYVVSEELFLQFEELEQRAYTGLIELSKFAFSDGIYAQYMRPDGAKAILDLLNPSTYVNTDFGVFVRNGGEELEKLNLMKEQIHPLVQNGGDAKSIAKLIDSNNFAAIHEIMDEMDVKLEQRQARQDQLQKYMTDMEAKTKQDQLDFQYYDADLKALTDTQVALIQQGMKIAENLSSLEADPNADKEKIDMTKIELEKNAIEMMKNATKLREIASKERMNKLDNETKLKNKTSGE
ncbi:MAG: hypothetical protein ACK53T_02325 [Planctomycetota bacterium]|jgi:hypothetical protein